MIVVHKLIIHVLVEFHKNKNTPIHIAPIITPLTHRLYNVHFEGKYCMYRYPLQHMQLSIKKYYVSERCQCSRYSNRAHMGFHLPVVLTTESTPYGVPHSSTIITA